MVAEIVRRGGGDMQLQTASGISFEWDEPGPGTFEHFVTHVYATREVYSVAGLGETGARGLGHPWQAARHAAQSLIAAAAFVPACKGVELRYISTPTAGGRNQVRMLVTTWAREAFSHAAVSALEAGCAALAPTFRWGTPRQPISLGAQSPGWDVVELRRFEELSQPTWAYVAEELGGEYFYTINDQPGDGSGWPTFWHTFCQVREPVEVSVLYRATELHWQEDQTIAQVGSLLRRAGEPHTEFDFMGNQVEYPADFGAKQALEHWDRRRQSLRQPLLARVAIRGEPSIAQPVANALASAISASVSPTPGAEPMLTVQPSQARDARQAAHGFDWLEVIPWGGSWIWETDIAPEGLRRIPYLYGIAEASGLAVLPVQDADGAPGFERSSRHGDRRATTRPGAHGAGVRIGRVLHYGAVADDAVIPLAALNRHTLVVGSPGSGKTSTVMSVLVELWNRHRIPFLVIESVKREYRGLLDVPGLQDCQIFSLGREDISPLRLNPLAPPPGVRCEVHANAVLSALKTALPLVPPLPELLQEAIERTYRVAGWDDDARPEDGIAPPTLRALMSQFNLVFEEQGYVGEARNIAAAMRVRLTSLLRGSKGKMLDTVESNDFNQLLSTPTVIEMDEIADPDDRAVLSALLLDRIRAGATKRGSSGGQLRHVTVVEEAHRLLARANLASGNAETGQSARADSVRNFCEAIAELRSYGEGFILSSQSPSALAEQAIANTGTRIIHRLGSAADRTTMLDDLDSPELDRQIAARLQTGTAIARWPQLDEAELVQVEPPEGVESARSIDDETVTDRMQFARRQTLARVPYRLCTRDICTSGCSPLVRKRAAGLATITTPTARRIWNQHEGTPSSLEPILRALVKAGANDAQQAYCCAVQLSVQDVALTQPPGPTDSDILATAVRRVVSQ